jgi:hypothetical protein
MNGKSGPAAASVARRLEANQLELGSLLDAVALALWPGNWSISVSLSFEVLHLGTCVRVRQFEPCGLLPGMFASQPLPTLLPKPWGD